jgi:hypothetical protein
MRRKRTALFALCLFLLTAGYSGLWLRAQQRQYALNRHLIAALVKDDTNAAIALVNEGANPNTRYTPSPMPSLNLLLVQLLHHKGLPANDTPTAFTLACGDFCCSQVAGATVLPVTVHEDLPLLNAMLVHGANIHTKVGNKRTILYEAVLMERLHTVELLLAHGADVNAQDETGTTPLMMTTTNGSPDVARLLFSYSAKPNMQDTDGNTVLHYAVLLPGAKSLLPEFLLHGADPNLRDKKGVSPLQLAQMQLRPDLVTLMRHGGK